MCSVRHGHLRCRVALNQSVVMTTVTTVTSTTTAMPAPQPMAAIAP
ncbi:hypothetical protein ACFPRL_32590 [Pseudoclavibacter helvolus]